MITDHFKVYIAGPITGVENANRNGFYRMQDRLDDMGVDSYNPRSEDVPVYCSPTDIQRVMMKISIHHLLNECDAIVLLEGWENSKGAEIEYLLGKYLSYAIYDHEFNRIA